MSRTPPHNNDAEQGLLAAIILDGGGDAMEKCIRAGVRPEWFYKTSHQIIFERATELYNAGKSVDDITLPEILHKKGELTAVGGTAYINELTRRIEVTAHAIHWMEIVREKAYMRKVIAAGTAITERAFVPGTTFDDMRKGIMPTLEELATLGQAERCVPTADVATAIIDDFNRWMRKEKRLVDPERMIETGVKELDAHMGRINPFKDFFITVAGESSHGKSTLLTFLIGHNCIRRKGAGRKRFAVFLAENTRESFILQLAGQLARFSTSWIAPDKSLADWEASHTERQRDRLGYFEQALHAVRAAIRDGWLLLFEDCKTSEFVTAQCRALVRQYGELHGFAVDYLQLLRSEDKDLARNREREVSGMVDQLRNFAKANRCPCFAISNLTKNRDMNDDLGPSRFDLKGSGDVYFSADRVWFVHRPETNFVTKEPQSKYSPVWCLLLNQDKHRAGPTLRLYLKVIPAYGGVNIYPDQPALAGASQTAQAPQARHEQKPQAALVASSFFDDQAIPDKEDE